MECDVLIVGQGLAGTVLGHFLEKRNKKVVFYDPGHTNSSSKVAAGIINPVTGRNYVKSWRINEMLPFALQTYKELGDRFSTIFHRNLPIVRALNFAAQENLWMAKSMDPDYARFISSEVNKEEIEKYVYPAFSYGLIHCAYQVDLPKILNTYRSHLIKNDLIFEDWFDYSRLILTDNGSIQYDGLKASKIIFSEGWQGQKNPLFRDQNFNLVKGEMLLVKIPGGHAFNLRHNIFFTPIGEDVYWVGSNYDRKNIDVLPSEERRLKMLAFLKDIIKVPYKVLDHKAGIRPATINREPIVKQHDLYKQMYFFNGMGAKGSSLIPFFANQLCDSMTL